MFIKLHYIQELKHIQHRPLNKLSRWMIYHLCFPWAQNKRGQAIGTICMYTMSYTLKAISKLRINRLCQYKAIICTRKAGQKTGLWPLMQRLYMVTHQLNLDLKWFRLVLVAYCLFQMFQSAKTSAWVPN